MLRNKSDVWANSTQSRIKSKNSFNKLPAYITLTDFMRIQNEINPINSEFENRRAYNNKLKMLSQIKSKNWPDSLEMKKKNRFELEKKKFFRFRRKEVQRYPR